MTMTRYEKGVLPPSISPRTKRGTTPSWVSETSTAIPVYRREDNPWDWASRLDSEESVRLDALIAEHNQGGAEPDKQKKELFGTLAVTAVVMVALGGAIAVENYDAKHTETQCTTVDPAVSGDLAHAADELGVAHDDEAIQFAQFEIDNQTRPSGQIFEVCVDRGPINGLRGYTVREVSPSEDTVSVSNN